jgi:hypothetical protein
MKSGNLNFLEPSGPLQACNGTALPLPYLRNHDMLNDRIDCFKINIYRNLIIQHLWQIFSSFLLMYFKQFYYNENLRLKIDSAGSGGDQLKPNYFMYFPWRLPETGLWILKFCLLFKRFMKPCFLFTRCLRSVISDRNYPRFNFY